MIREVTAADYGPLFLLMKEAHEESITRFVPVDWGKCLGWICKCRDEGFAMVAEKDGEVIGAMLGHKEAPWFSEQEYAVDVFTFVSKAHRGTGAGLKLYRTFLRWAHENETPVFIGQNSGVQVERVEKIFGHLGLTKCGSVFIEVI